MSINKGMDKEDIVHIYNGILLSHRKSKVIICSNMDGPRNDHTKWSKSEKDILQYCFYVESKKYGTSECIYKTDSKTYGYQRGNVM